MIKPALQDDALLADVEAAKSDRPNFRLWWLGQSGFLVQFNARHALLDPYLSDSLTAKYAQSDRPHVRMTERVIAPERLAFVDVVTSSHNHTDHFDPDTLKPLLAAKPALPLLLPEANRGAGAFRIGLSLKAPNLLGVRAGDVKAWCLGIPFLRPGDVPRSEAEGDPYLNGKRFEWDIAGTSDNWRKTHNFRHHTYTNIHGMVFFFKQKTAYEIGQ